MKFELTYQTDENDILFYRILTFVQVGYLVPPRSPHHFFSFFFILQDTVKSMVIMASPRRRLVVQAVFQLRRLARHGLGDYGVASRALVVALASDSSRRTLHGRKIGCARGKKGGGKRARGKSSAYTSRVGAPHPSSTQNREIGRERE